jgi:hypothetical protein
LKVMEKARGEEMASGSYQGVRIRLAASNRKELAHSKEWGGVLVHREWDTRRFFNSNKCYKCYQRVSLCQRSVILFAVLAGYAGRPHLQPVRTPAPFNACKTDNSHEV